MEKKNIDWGNLGFSYVKTDKRYVSNYKDGKWEEGYLTEDNTIVSNNYIVNQLMGEYPYR